MITPAPLTLTANRWAPFLQQIVFPLGVDLTGATFRMQVRKGFDADGAGDLLIDLASASAGSQGLSATVDTSGIAPVSTLTIQIDKPTLAAVEEPEEIGNDLSAAFDILVHPAAGDPYFSHRGPFIIEPGVTR